MSEHEDFNVLAALRHEPEQTAFLIKLTLVAVVAIAAWEVLAGMALPVVLVTVGLELLLLGYGGVVTFVVARIMVSSPRPEAGISTGRLSPAGRRALASVESDRRYAHLGDDAPAAPTSDPEDAGPAVESTVFNETYFLLRLQEQVKDARRDNRAMAVAAVDVTVPGHEMTPELSDRIAYEMARIAASQARIIGQPLAVSESEYIFSMPHMTPSETKTFVSEVVQALGDYWCHFGVATFPKNAHDAEGLVAKAREACDASRSGGKRSRVEYPASA